MSTFTDRELEYPGERRPGPARTDRDRRQGQHAARRAGRLAIQPRARHHRRRRHEPPADEEVQDVRRNGPAATVIDDLASVDPWQPRGVEIRGRAEAIEADRALSRIHPDRIVSWGIRNPEVGRRHSRDVTVTQE